MHEGMQLERRHKPDISFLKKEVSYIWISLRILDSFSYDLLLSNVYVWIFTTFCIDTGENHA